MSKFHDDRTEASDRVQIDVSEEMLRRLEPELFGWRSLFFKFNWANAKLGARRTIELIAEHMTFGDSRAAIVIQSSPLVVAAYTDELDCVALLGFPDWLERERALRSGTKLLTVNTYGRGKRAQPDLIPGPASLNQWTMFMPIIAEFISNSVDVINRRKQAISKAEWERTWASGKEMPAAGRPIRDGRPLHSWKSPTRPRR